MKMAKVFTCDILITALLTCVVVVTPSHAEKLESALAQLLARNSSLLAAQSQYNAQHAEQYAALSTMLPHITAYAQRTTSETEATYAGGVMPMGSQFQLERPKFKSEGYGVEIRQEVFTSGKNFNAFRAKRAEIRAAKQDLIETEQQIILQGITAYLDVLQAEAVLELNRKNETILDKRFEATRDRFQVGVGTRTDVAQAEAGLAGALSSRLSAGAALNSAKAVYQEVFAIAPQELEPPKELPLLPATLDQAQIEARKDNPVLASRQETAARGRYEVYSTIGGALPSVTITGTYAYDENPNGITGAEAETTRVVARVNVPIFLGGRSIAAISASTDVRNALTQNVHVVSRAVTRGVVQAWNNYQASVGVIEARKQQINASEQALDGVRQENRLGTRTTLDVLNADQALLDARVGLLRAERNQYLAAYSLLASVGHLTSKKLRIQAAQIEAE